MKPEKYFQNKTAVITGAASGIGRAFAEQLAAMGTDLVLSDINMTRLEEVKQALKKFQVKVVTTRCDVTNEQEVNELAKLAIDSSKTVDFLFSNAGIASAGYIKYIEMDQWDRIIRINLYGMIHCVRAFLPKMVEQGSGHIIVTGSSAGSLGVGGLGPYSTTKFANSGFCEALYGEYKPHGINVSVLTPFPLKTNLIETVGINIPPHLTDNVSPETVKKAIEAGKMYYWERFTAKKGMLTGFCGGTDTNVAVANYLRQIANKKLYIFERWNGRFFQLMRGFWPGMYKKFLSILGNRNTKLLDDCYHIMEKGNIH
jgi:short-subunit dehydrogenase